MVELVKRHYMIIIVSIVSIVLICYVVMPHYNDEIELIVNSEDTPTRTSSVIGKSNLFINNLNSSSHMFKTELKTTETYGSNINPVPNTDNSGVNDEIISDKDLTCTDTSVKEVTIPVYICGEVKNPGVYEVNCENLINDIVNLAGGLTEEADPKAVNLASQISSNQMVIIPKIGEELSDIHSTTCISEQNTYENEIGEQGYSDKGTLYSESNVESNIININTADKELLMSLPGIGEVKANAIIEYRESVGRFYSTSDIKNVSGIGEKTFEKLAKLITI